MQRASVPADVRDEQWWCVQFDRTIMEQCAVGPIFEGTESRDGDIRLGPSQKRLRQNFDHPGSHQIIRVNDQHELTRARCDARIAGACKPLIALTDDMHAWIPSRLLIEHGQSWCIGTIINQHYLDRDRLRAQGVQAAR